MPRIGLYVSAADKAWLDELPLGVSWSAIFREAISQARGEGCDHDRLELRCRDCGARLPVDHMHTWSESEAPEELLDPIEDDPAGEKTQVSDMQTRYASSEAG